MPRCTAAMMAVAHLVSLACVSSGSSRKPEMTNHVFIKTPKCASSTAGGIARRLATHANLSHTRDGATRTPDPAFEDDVEPRVYANHVRRRDLDRHRDFKNLKLPVFPRWTIIRHPASRALSAYYYFEVEHGGASTDDKAILRWLQKKSRKNDLFDYIKPNKCKTVDCVLDAYDFIGVVELFDQSMLQLASVVDAPLASILYLPSKITNSTPHDSTAKIRHGVDGQTPAVRAYLTSTAWRERNALDYKLWETVHKTVAGNAVGDEDRLRRYRDMLSDVAAKCANLTNGTSGYWGDNGVGFECLDSIYGN